MNTNFAEYMRSTCPQTSLAVHELAEAMNQALQTHGKRTLFGGDKGAKPRAAYLAALRRCGQAMLEEGLVDANAPGVRVATSLFGVFATCERPHDPTWANARRYWEVQLHPDQPDQATIEVLEMAVWRDAHEIPSITRASR